MRPFLFRNISIIDAYSTNSSRNFFSLCLVEQELLTLPEHLGSKPRFLVGFVLLDLVFCVVFLYQCLSICPFSVGNCSVCPSLIYGFGLPHRHLQSFLVISYFYFDVVESKLLGRYKIIFNIICIICKSKNIQI